MVPSSALRSPSTGCAPPTEVYDPGKGTLTDAELSGVILYEEVKLKGQCVLDGVYFNAPVRFEDADATLTNIWFCGMLAEPTWDTDPDMQQEQNHKAVYCKNSVVSIDGFLALNNDDVFQCGNGSEVTFKNGTARLLAPFTRTHRDCFDIDDGGTYKFRDLLITSESNSCIFAKQEDGSGNSIDLLDFGGCTFAHGWPEDPLHRCGHSIWIGKKVKRVTFTNCYFDARPTKTIVRESADTEVTFDNSVYSFSFADHVEGETPKLSKP